MSFDQVEIYTLALGPFESIETLHSATSDEAGIAMNLMAERGEGRVISVSHSVYTQPKINGYFSSVFITCLI